MAAAHLRIGNLSATAGKKGKQRPGHPKHRSRHDHHMQAGDGEDVEQAGIAHGLVVFLGNAGALAGDQRRGHLTAFAGKARADAGIDSGAQAIDRQPQRQVQGRIAHVLEPLGLPGGVADAAKTVEPGATGEVEAGGDDWLRWRLKRRPQPDRLAGFHPPRRRAQAYPHAIRRLFGRQIAKGDDPQRDPGAALVTQLVELDPTLDIDPVHFRGEDRSPHQFGAELGGGEAERNRQRHPTDDKAERQAFGGDGEPSGGHDQGQRGDGAGFVRKREVEDDADAEKHRDPKRPTVGFGFERAGKSDGKGRASPARLAALVKRAVLVPARHRPDAPR
jgi:hypothetical protein